MNNGDTAWLLVSAALVMLMTPGLAMFYGGMVRRKNILGTIMQSFILIAVISIEWMLVGYSFAFGPDLGGIIGDLSWFGLSGVGALPFKGYAATVPHQAFMIYQMMFAVITPALISGAFAERFKFSAYLVFTLLWALLVYNPVAHWMWGIGGWLRNLGALDFAGGTVVHLTAGVSALAAVPDRETEGVRARQPGAARPPDDGTGGGHPVVRLVRVQRRERPRGGRPLLERFRGYPHVGRRGDRIVDAHGVVPPGETHRAGGRIRVHRRARDDHPGFRVRDAARGPRDRPGRRGRVLQRRDAQGEVQLRRLP